MNSIVTPQSVLEMLRQLPPRDRLKVIAQVLPETERELPEKAIPLKSLWGICADLGSAPSAEEIDEVRREIWASLERDDI